MPKSFLMLQSWLKTTSTSKKDIDNSSEVNQVQPSKDVEFDDVENKAPIINLSSTRKSTISTNNTSDEIEEFDDDINITNNLIESEVKEDKDQKDENYIDRLAYHHFYMWVGDEDIDVKSVTGDLNNFDCFLLNDQPLIKPPYELNS